MKNLLILAAVILFSSCSKTHTIEEFKLNNPNIEQRVNNQIPFEHKINSISFQKIGNDKFKVGVGYACFAKWGVYYGIFDYNGKLCKYERG